MFSKMNDLSEEMFMYKHAYTCVYMHVCKLVKKIMYGMYLVSEIVSVVTVVPCLYKEVNK